MTFLGDRKGLLLLIQIWAVFIDSSVHGHSTQCPGGVRACQPAPTAFPKLPPAIQQFPIPLVVDDVEPSVHHPPKCCGAPPTLPSLGNPRATILSHLSSLSPSTVLLPQSTPSILLSINTVKQQTTTKTTDTLYLSTVRILKCRETASPVPCPLGPPPNPVGSTHIPVCPRSAVQSADVLRTAPRAPPSSPTTSAEPSPTAPVPGNEVVSQPQEVLIPPADHTVSSESLVVSTSWVTSTAQTTDTQTHVEYMTSYTTVEVTQSMTCCCHH